MIIIDDASTDNTREAIFQNYRNYLDDNFLKYHLLCNNKGVTFAKNKGANEARNEWLVFLDSDDQLLSGSRVIICNAIKDFPDADLFFFRCVDNNLKLIGPEINESIELSFSEYVKHGTYAECLPVIKKSVFLNYPYDSDLRGFEGLSYLKMLVDGVKAIIVQEPVRKYSFDGEDRLSSAFNLLKRSDKILLGNKKYYDIVKNQVNIQIKISILLRIFKYRLFLIMRYIVNKISIKKT